MLRSFLFIEKLLFIDYILSMPICPFCKRLVSHFKANSHTIPEWMYKESRTYGKKGHAIAYDRQNNTRNIVQQGYKGAFICNNCENEISKLDSYASTIFKDRDIFYSKKNIKKKRITEITGIDIGSRTGYLWSSFNFKKIQNFIYSVCLRQHFYHLSKGQKGLIIEKHLKSLLQLYHSNKIDDESYPIFIIYCKKSELNRAVMVPSKRKMAGHHIVNFVACGFQFIVKVSSHNGLFNDDMKLKHSGSILMPEMDAKELGVIRGILLHTIRFQKEQNLFKKY